MINDKSNRLRLLSEVIFLAAALTACGGLEQDEYSDEYSDESAVFETGRHDDSDASGEGTVAELDNQGTPSKEGKACNSSTGPGPYAGENGTYDSRGDCCWTHCSSRYTCSTSCLDCSTGG